MRRASGTISIGTRPALDAAQSLFLRRSGQRAILDETGGGAAVAGVERGQAFDHHDRVQAGKFALVPVRDYTGPCASSPCPH